MQVCLHQTFTLEAKCRATLATRESQAIAVHSGIGQRHDALVSLEHELSLTRTRLDAIRASTELDSSSLTARQAWELDDAQTRLSEEVSSVEAEVAARSEVLRRYVEEAAAKATLEQLEFRDAITRACQASEERYRAELNRERETHKRAREALPADVDGNVTYTCDLELRVRENELIRDRMLKGHDINSLHASGQQLVT